MKTSKLILNSLLVMGLVFTSCRKSNLAKDDSDSDTTESNEQSFAENASSDVVNIGSSVLENDKLQARGQETEELLGSCAIIKRDSILKIDSVIFNGSACYDGRIRSGLLIFNYSASTNGATRYRHPGFKCSVTSSNYKVENRSVNIIYKTIENTTPANFGEGVNLTWKITGHIKVENPEKGTHEVIYTRFKTLLNTSNSNVYHGTSTPISWNLARVGITGEATGTSAKGVAFTCNITRQLVRDFGACSINGKHPFIEGTLELSPGKRATRTIDFGNGTCDLDATVTVRGKTRNISL